MGYDEIYKILPNAIFNEIRKYLEADWMQEIRVKIGKPIILNSSREEKILDYIATNEDLKYMIMKISNYSLYAFEEDIKNKS